MPEIEVNIEVYCAGCGEGLCNQTESTRTRTRGEPAFFVEPCQTCLNKAEQEGRDNGYDEGYEKGRQDEAGESEGD